MSLSTGRRINRQHFQPLPILQDILDEMYWMALRNSRGLDVRELNLRPFLDGTDEDNDDESTYNKTGGEGSKTIENGDDPPPGQNSGSGDAWVIETDLRNLQRNSGVKNVNTEDNEEYWQITESEAEETIIPSENENVNEPNNLQNDLKIKQ